MTAGEALWSDGGIFDEIALQIAAAWDEGYAAALRNERTIIEDNWDRNPYRDDGTNSPPATSNPQQPPNGESQ